MANLFPKLIAQIAKIEANQYLDRYRPPSYDDVLHDGLVGSGEMLGTTAGMVGGAAIGGLPGAIAGPGVLAPLGALAGGWVGHGAYHEGRLIKDIISHSENWTVDAAGAIVPVMPPSAAPSNTNYSNGSGTQPVRPSSPVRNSAQPSASGDQSTVGYRSSVFDTGAPPLSFVTSPSRDTPGGLPGLLAEAGFSDPRYPNSPTPGGLPRLILEYLRTDPSRSD
jgi:hypothetical protein